MTTPTTCTRNGTTYVLKPAHAICRGCVAESPTGNPTELCLALDPCMTFDGSPFAGIWVEADEAPVTAAERSLYFFCQYKRAGSFDTALWNAFCCADLTNQHLLAKGFPEHAEAWRKYSTVPGWWPALEARIGKGE